MNKDNVMKMAISVLIVGALLFVTYFIMNFDKSDGKSNFDLTLELSSDIVSNDPKESAANFINHNGTIGDLSSMTEEDILSRDFKENMEMRREAFERVKDAVLPDGPLIDGREEDAILNDLAHFPSFYSISNLRVSEPSETTKLIVEHNEIGPVEYESVKVKVDFRSTESTFVWPTDVGSDGIMRKEESYDDFEETEVTLVRSGDLWFIYDVEDSEYTLNARMATWSGRGMYDVSPDREIVDEYILDDIYGSYEEEDND